MSTTNKETLAAFNVLWAVAEVIQTAGEIPSGEVYALLMGKMDLATYQKLLGCLVTANMVKERNHLLTWIGPGRQWKERAL